VEPGPLRVRHGAWEGILVNISELGALVQLPVPEAVNTRVTFDVEWDDVRLQLSGRVVRSNPSFPQTAAAPLARTDYYIAIEFSRLATECSATLQGMVGHE
jgi:hypothetical protein